jgi:hypothetical protein
MVLETQIQKTLALHDSGPVSSILHLPNVLVVPSPSGPYKWRGKEDEGGRVRRAIEG